MLLMCVSERSAGLPSSRERRVLSWPTPAVSTRLDRSSYRSPGLLKGWLQVGGKCQNVTVLLNTNDGVATVFYAMRLWLTQFHRYAK